MFHLVLRLRTRAVVPAVVACVVALLFASATALARTPLKISEARVVASHIARDYANKNDADGWRVGRCSRFTRFKAKCATVVYGLPGPAASIDCYSTVVVTVDSHDNVNGRNTNVDCL